MAEAAHHAGRYLDAAALVGTDALEAFLGAKDGRRRAVRQRRAHRQGERIGDRRRGKDLVDAEGLAELREGVVHRMAVVLRRNRGDLPLGGAVGLHVIAAQGGVDLHELAIGLVRLGAGWRHHAFAHADQGLVVLFCA
ncbi:hypothetical protein D9M71_420690 [compost metagenome]